MRGIMCQSRQSRFSFLSVRFARVSVAVTMERVLEFSSFTFHADLVDNVTD